MTRVSRYTEPPTRFMDASLPREGAGLQQPDPLNLESERW